MSSWDEIYTRYKLIAVEIQRMLVQGISVE